MNNEYFVELRFPVLGAKLKIDHGYSLYAAIKKHLCDNYPELLVEGNILVNTRISTIKGTNLLNGYIHIKNFSRLRIRCDIKYAYQLMTVLDNQLLGLAGDSIFIESGYIHKMTPAKTLTSRLVIIRYPREVQLNYKSAQEESRQQQFIKSCYKQLDKYQIKGKVEITQREEKPIINSMTVEKPPCLQRYLGYGVTISELTDLDSLRLQVLGVGGKKHFGCGWFDAIRKPTQEASGG